MSEELIIRNCAPTLAGLKTGCIFCAPYESRSALMRFIRTQNQKLVPKGLRLLPLRFSDARVLIYLYRPKALRRDLAGQQASSLLLSQGYEPGCCEKIIAQLIRRLRSQAEFPHEIGLFLGYPPEDVQGYMDNKACNCKCVGCWKVYGDEAAAKKRFALYKKCTRVYCDQWAKGKALERLTVAS